MLNTTVNKAVVALLGSVVALVGEFGLDVSWAGEGIISAVGALVTTALVYFVPNKEPETTETE